MKFIILYLFLIPTLLFSQSFFKLESNDSLKKYKSVEIVNYSNNKKTSFSRKITLENGEIKTIENFNKSNLIYKSEYNYDLKMNLDFEIVKFDVNKGKINDTINCIYIYNSNNQLIENDFVRKEFYSNFNSQNLPQTIQTEKTKIDSIFGYKTELKYDSLKSIIEEKVYSKNEKGNLIEINKYKYDIFKNLIEVNRTSIPKEIYPVMILGGRNKYENEKYRYVYNKDNLWTEKYWIVEKKEYLIEKRKFRK